MADNLPLLPDKGPLCVDVRSVLQEVFRESDYLPPLDGLSHQADLTNNASLDTDLWIKNLSLESAKLNNHEENLQKEYAKRLAKDSLPNIYKLHSISSPKKQNKWKDDLGLLERKDLKPTIQQDATREGSLWIKNILNGSSGNISTFKVAGSKINAQLPLQLADENSVQSISWGETAPTLPVHPILSSLNTPVPDYIICIPPQLQFINFKIGQLYTQSLRLLNMSKFEMRVSIRPPTHRELDVQLCSRLVITSGSASEIKINFRPNDVRVLCDKLVVRVSSGQILFIPIECFMEPPMLYITIPTIALGLSSLDPIITVQDVLDLGARLLGDLHRSQLVLHCAEYHASFFLLSEDAWLDYSIQVAINSVHKIPTYGVVADCFFISPVIWSGGGIIRGLAVCHADGPGLHTAVLRILCSTAIVRPLHVVADAVLFCPKHITLQAQDKDYDICSEDDPACEYYVHLGTSFPKCCLSASVTIVNHSPVSYNYYWSVRPWGVCSCWKQSNGSQKSDDHDSDLCPGALHAKLKTTLQGNNELAGDEASLAVRVEQVRGCLSPRQDVTMSVRVPDVGETLGLRRAVLMLILTDIPKESFPPDYDPMIVNVNIIEEEAIPGVSPRWSREVCEVVCAEMEVWWEVVPIKFALDPPLLLVPYSRRVKSINVALRATQLYGVTSIKALWEMNTLAPAPLQLLPGQSSFTNAVLPLKDLLNEFPEISCIRLISEKAEWSVSSSLQCWSSNRALPLRQARLWLGVLPPGSPVAAKLIISNDTHQHGNNELAGDEASLAVRVEQVRGCLSPRQDVTMSVRVPDVGETLGLRRAVLMLILTDIPKESFPPDYDPMIVNVNIIEEEAIPGVSPRWSREVCEVVCAEMEVWWEVVPIKFALDPPLLLVPYSRRVKSINVALRATQLYGVTSIKALWEMNTLAPAPLQLLPGQSSFTNAVLPLKDLLNEFPEISCIRLISEKAEWSVSSSLQCWSSNRALPLRQARLWLGVLPPGSPVAAKLIISNDTHQHINWSGTCYRWYRERPVAKACVGRPPCAICSSRVCTCSSLTPYRGSLNCMQQISLQYQANAPDTDGCVATLIQVRRSETDTCHPLTMCGSQRRASLVAYRVLAPCVTIGVLSCGIESKDCKGCDLDNRCCKLISSPLRPRAALVAGETQRFRLLVTNITPIPTRVKWDQAIEGEDDLKVTLIPNEFELGSYSHAIVMVVLEARRVTGRRLFVRRASVVHSYKPLYLLIDVAISGVEVIAEFPIGGAETTDSSVSIKMIQKEMPRNMSEKKTLYPAALFAEDDRKREIQKVNICNCRYKMVYIPPKKQHRPPSEHTHVEIVEEPPPLTRICPCAKGLKPVMPDDSEPYCLQFTNIPLRTVRSRTIILRNVCGLEARWRSAVRRYPRVHVRTENRDQWSGDVREPGVVLDCSPAHGTVRAGSVVKFFVSVYSDCWGLYHDQILIQIEDMEPLVVDVWIEVVGDALCFALQLQRSIPPVLWMSQSDPDRVINVTNTSRAELTVFTYILKNNDYPQEELPFRLYLRLFDVLPRVCPCLTAFSSKTIIDEESGESSVCLEDMDTGVELFLAPDYGVLDEAFYQVDPSTFSLKSQETTSLKVRLLPRHELAPATSILLRCLPVNKYGDTWYRPPPALQSVSLREAARRPCLQTTCSEIRVALCALDMPTNEVIRIRKRFNVRNVGEGFLETTAVTESPWRLDVSRNICNAHCTNNNNTYSDNKKLNLPPRSCIEIVVVLTLKTNEIWPIPGESYLPRTITSNALYFYDHEDIMLLSIPFILDLDMPVLTTQPELIDFGFISDGYTRKSYFSVKHSSRSAVIELVTSWSGDENFRIWPSRISLRPGVSERVYVQCIGRWKRGDVSAGTVHVHTPGDRKWCGVMVPVRAFVSRRRPPPPADHTDDIHLMPLL